MDAFSSVHAEERCDLSEQHKRTREALNLSGGDRHQYPMCGSVCPCISALSWNPDCHGATATPQDAVRDPKLLRRIVLARFPVEWAGGRLRLSMVAHMQVADGLKIPRRGIVAE